MEMESNSAQYLMSWIYEEKNKIIATLDCSFESWPTRVEKYKNKLRESIFEKKKRKKKCTVKANSKM